MSIGGQRSSIGGQRSLYPLVPSLSSPTVFTVCISDQIFYWRWRRPRDEATFMLAARVCNEYIMALDLSFLSPFHRRRVSEYTDAAVPDERLKAKDREV